MCVFKFWCSSSYSSSDGELFKFDSVELLSLYTTTVLQQLVTVVQPIEVSCSTIFMSVLESNTQCHPKHLNQAMLSIMVVLFAQQLISLHCFIYIILLYHWQNIFKKKCKVYNNHKFPISSITVILGLVISASGCKSHSRNSRFMISAITWKG